jgi:hypothetical protein
VAPIVYVLGTLVTLACAILLLRGYSRSHTSLLLWSGLCFGALAVSNFLVFLDLVIYPEVNLYRARLVTAVIALAMLLYGLIWEDR